MRYVQSLPRKPGWYWIRPKGYRKGKLKEVSYFSTREPRLYFCYWMKAFFLDKLKPGQFEFSDEPIPECEN